MKAFKSPKLENLPSLATVPKSHIKVDPVAFTKREVVLKPRASLDLGCREATGRPYDFSGVAPSKPFDIKWTPVTNFELDL